MKEHEEISGLLAHYPELLPIVKEIWHGYDILQVCFEKGGKLLLCGNGGSAADSDHIVGELLKGFKSKRRIPRTLDFHAAGAKNPQFFFENLQGGLPAVSLTGHAALLTAWCNDVDARMVFAQQVYALAKPADVLLALSTSGNSENIVNAVVTARAQGMRTIGMTGAQGGQLAALCDCCICVPAEETYRVQEYHLPIYHVLCAMLETHFFQKEDCI